MDPYMQTREALSDRTNTFDESNYFAANFSATASQLITFQKAVM